jgi:hypothetical protein
VTLETIFVIFLIVAGILGIIKLDLWMAQRRMDRQIEAWEREEELFNRNLDTLWVKPEKNDGKENKSH